VENLLKKVNRCFDKFKEDYVSEYTAECAYYTILSFIPFIIFFITLIQYTNVDKETIFFIIREMIPTTMHDMILGIIDEVYSKSVGTMSIAVLVALWSSGKGFFSLCKGLRKIYKVETPKTNTIMRIEGTIYSLIFILAIVMFLVMLVLGNRINNIVIQKFEAFSIVTTFILKIRIFILIILTFILFLFIYKFVPKHKLKLRTQVYGALFTSIAWYIISWVFSIYINIFDGFSNTYGSLTSIILIMMWVYTCMYVILVGAEINTLVREYKISKDK